jgi:aspartate/methionine/tyrosine aminotransferase
MFNGKKQTTISRYLPDKTIIFSAISKVHGAGGWRVGFCIVPDALEDVKKTMMKLFPPSPRPSRTPLSKPTS